MQRWSEVPSGTALFESLFVFENYPVYRSGGGAQDTLSLRSTPQVERTNYALTLVAVPRDELVLRLTYDSDRFSALEMMGMVGHLSTAWHRLCRVCAGCAHRAQPRQPSHGIQCEFCVSHRNAGVQLRKRPRAPPAALCRPPTGQADRPCQASAQYCV